MELSVNYALTYAVRTVRVSTQSRDLMTGFSTHSFIHSGHFYSASSSPLLLRGAPDTARMSFTPKRHRQLWVKDLPEVHTWRLELDWNPRLFGRMTSNLPMRHQVP